MPRITVLDFQISERAASKMKDRNIVVDDLYDVIDSDYEVVPNRSGHPAPYVLIGRDRSGRCLAIPVAPTHDPYVWRPITAWKCKPRETAKLR